MFLVAGIRESVIDFNVKLIVSNDNSFKDVKEWKIIAYNLYDDLSIY